MSEEREVISFKYFFGFDDGSSKEFVIELHSKTLDMFIKDRENIPDWAQLDHCKCPNCPFDSKVTEFCPIALNMIEIIEQFRDCISFEHVDVRIVSEGREYNKRTSLQESLSSIIGIYMVTSGCPIMQKLKPMVRTHLPFATLEETNYRVLSMYLLAQYFIYKKGGVPDWDMKQLVKVYEDIRHVNQSFCRRLLEVQVEDATLNAVVILDTFADYIPFSINENLLEEVELLFSAYLSPGDSF